MKSRVALYWLLVSLAFTLTQPGAVAFANWDAPYGFYKDLSTWMSCAGAFLIIATAYGLIEWRRERLSPLHPLGAGIVTTLTILLGYWAEGQVRGQMGYGTSNILTFIIGGFLGLVLSLTLLLTVLPYLILGGGLGELYQPYDRPLLAAWLISLAVSAVLLAVYAKTRRGLRNRVAESFKNHPDR